MWNELFIPNRPAPIRAYTHANESVLFICTSAGVFALNLNDLTSWHFIAERFTEYMLYCDELVQYDEYGAITFRGTYSPIYGYPTEDSEGCSDIPLDEHSLSGDRLDYDVTSDTLFVVNASSHKTNLTIEQFGATSDNWATAGFSEDGRHLTVGNLQRLRVFAYSQDTAADVPS